MKSKEELKSNFIKKVKAKYGDEFDLTKVDYVNNKTKVSIGCKKHGYFSITPLNLLQGHGCQKCVNKYHYTNNEWIEKVSKIHNYKYDYTKTNYINATTKVCIICPEHGEFWQTPNNHLNGAGCQKCNIDRLAIQSIEKAKKNFVEKANEVHNSQYDYSLVEYCGNETPIKVICKKHGIFQITPHNHLQGHGCHCCSKSLGENKIDEILTRKNIPFEREKTFVWLVNKGRLRLDFYLPSHNAAIEFQGEGHYFPVNWAKKDYQWALNNLHVVQGRDERKRNLCSENNVVLYYINYNDNIEEKLNEILKEIENRYNVKQK